MAPQPSDAFSLSAASGHSNAPSPRAAFSPSDAPGLSDAPSLSNILSQAAARLSEAGIDSARTDAELLLAHVLRVSRAEVQRLVLLGTEISDADADTFADLIAERTTRVPLQHLTGVAHFRELELKVGPGVFVPRPETESLVQLALDWLAEADVAQPVVVDLGTGSAAIALSIATEHPSSRVYAVELSPLAHSWAQVNVASSDVVLVLGSLADSFGELDGQVDLVISNPPYIPDAAVPRQAEARDHDPELALYGGSDGLEVPRLAVARARDLLRPGGYFVMEHAEVQEASAAALMNDADTWHCVTGHRDLTGRPRATSAVRV